MANPIALVTKLAKEGILDSESLKELIEARNEGLESFISVKARKVLSEKLGNKITIKGRISLTNRCKGDCFFCGIRKSNMNCDRYMLTKEQVEERVKLGYDNGIRRFELSSGETDDIADADICNIISSLKESYPDITIELSLGEKKYSSYLSYFRAGAKGYNLRFENSDAEGYSRLCPMGSIDNRRICIAYLKQVGFDMGTGFLVGAPFGSNDINAGNLLYVKETEPSCIDIAPFVPHPDTPLAKFKPGKADKTLFMIAMLRLICPTADIVANEALDVLLEKGRKKAVTYGANVVTVSLDSENACETRSLYGKEIPYEEPEKTIASVRNKIVKLGFEAV